MKKCLLILFCVSSILCSINSFAQQPQFKSKHLVTIRGNFNVPNAVRNRAYRKSFNGIYDLNGIVIINPVSGFIIGAGYKNSQFDIPNKLIAGLRTTYMHFNSIFGRVGYNHYQSDIFFISGAINAGQNFTKFTGVPCIDHKRDKYVYGSFYFEPEAGINFMIEEFFSIGVNVSLNINTKSFDPYFLCLEDFNPYYPEELGKNMMTLNFGFGFTYGIIPKKGVKIDRSIE